jgi:hypothetical protein
MSIIAILNIDFMAVYGRVIMVRNTLSGKEVEMDAVGFALKKIGVNKPTWQTIVVGTSREVDVPPAAIWKLWSQLEMWPTWSKPLHNAARWTGSGGWEVGSRFEQDLNLGFPLGAKTSAETVGEIIPGEQVIWWKDENGVKSCHVWSFEALADGRTKVTDVEVFHGVPMGLVKPLVAGDWQRKFEASVEGLVAKAQAQG